MVAHHLPEVVGEPVLAVGTLIGKQQIVPDAAANGDAAHPLHGGCLPIQRDQRLVVDVEVLTHLRKDTRGAGAALARLEVAAMHAVHVGRRRTEVADMPLEVGPACQIRHLRQHRPLAPRADEPSLMGGDGAEAAPAKAPTVNGDGVLDHLPCGDVATLGILGVRGVHHPVV